MSANKLNHKKALFLDRDGVINADTGYPIKWSDLKLVDGILDLVRYFDDKSYKVIVVTNQSGIGRGYFSDRDFRLLMDNLFKFFSENNAPLKDYYHCPCDPTKNVCFNRKPNPGLILKAAKEHFIDLTNSIFVGDKESDMAAGVNAGVGNLFLYNNKVSSVKIGHKIKKLNEVIDFHKKMAVIDE